MKDCLVSIAIPAYKDFFLSEAIESALNQDYPNIELIIVNDCSPSDLGSIVNGFSDERIRYYVNKKNLGKRSIVHNWNRCLELAQGDFFVLLCDDDVLMPNFVSELLKLADQYPQCNVFHARREIIDVRDSGSHVIEDVWPQYETGEAFTKNTLLGKRKHTISEFLYRTSHIQKIKYQVFPVGFYSDDASLILLSQNGGITSSVEPLILFRYSDSHISSNPKYNKGKAKAAKRFLRWVRVNHIIKKEYPIYKKKIECESLIYFYEAQGWNKISVMFNLPVSSITIKAIIRHCKSLFRKIVREYFR